MYLHEFYVLKPSSYNFGSSKEAAVAYGELLLQDGCDSLPEEDASAIERSWVPYKGGSRHSEDGPMHGPGMNERGGGGIRVRKGKMPFLNIL